VLPEGRVELVMGTMSSGQGHETSFAQLVTDWLGVPFESITYVAHDTARVTAGGGSHSGRSMKLATTIIGKATDDIIDKGRKIASFLLETGEIDIEFERGRYRVAGTDREVGIFEVAAAAVTREDLLEELQGPLAGISDQTLPIASFPYGTQVCEVEVDPKTGEVEIVRYSAVDDLGRAINPLILHGQTHGGIAQGVGQALLENSYYEPESGQLLAASFMDYAIPRADTLPYLGTRLSEVPSPSARCAFRRRGRDNPCLGSGDQCYRRRARGVRSAPYRDAGDARAGMAGSPCSSREKNVKAQSHQCHQGAFPLRRLAVRVCARTGALSWLVSAGGASECDGCGAG
jgi:aerobic carbon-monoxide dehydrogenase large subunit